MPNKAVLINLPIPDSYRSNFMFGDSLSLASIAQCLIPNKIDVAIYDCLIHQWSIDELVGRIGEFDFAGISIMDYDESAIEKAKEVIANLLKLNPAAYITVGGAGPTLNAKKYLELNVNSVAEGSNIFNLSMVLEDAENFEKSGVTSRTAKIIDINNPRGKNFRYSTIYRPDLSLAFEMDRIICTESSKGCYGGCKFCSIHYEHNCNWIPRDLDCLLSEIDYVKESLPSCTEIRFIDANFLGGGSKNNERVSSISKHLKGKQINYRIECRVNDVCEEMFIELKENGLVGVYLGIENSDQNVLYKLNKGISAKETIKAVSILKNLRISYSYGFIMITPFSSHDSICENINFLKEIEYGVRWKHLFSKLILLKEQVFDVNKPIENYELKPGYHCEDETCSKLLYFYEIFRNNFLHVLELEHIVGASIKRGKEVRDERFWQLDKDLSDLCLNIFESLLSKIRSVKFEHDDIYTLTQHYMMILDDGLNLLLDKIKLFGLEESVMMKALEEHIR